MKPVSLLLIALACGAIPPTAAFAAGANSHDDNALSLNSLRAQSAIINGDWYKAAVLAEKSYNKQPSLNNEFNLATAYQHTGRSMLAIPLYEEVAKNGKYVTGYYIYDYYRTKATDPASFNYAAEAARRLDVILSQSPPRYSQALAQREEGEGPPR